MTKLRITLIILLVLTAVITTAYFLVTSSGFQRQWLVKQILYRAEKQEFPDHYRIPLIKELAGLRGKEKNLQTLKRLEDELKPETPSDPYDFTQSLKLAFLGAYTALGDTNAFEELTSELEKLGPGFLGSALDELHFTRSLRLAGYCTRFFSDTSLGSTRFHLDYDRAPQTEEEAELRKSINDRMNPLVRDEALFAVTQLLEDRGLNWGFEKDAFKRYEPEDFDRAKRILDSLQAAGD